MLTISQIATIFAKLDENEDEVDAVAKALRNLTQRFPLPPSATEGRSFLYDRAAVVAIRLCYTAHQFGLNRVLLHPYALFLEQEATHAIQAVEAGQDFAFHVAARPIGEDIWAEWESSPYPDSHEANKDADEKRADRAMAYLRDGGDTIELGRFTQRRNLVAQLLAALPAGLA